MASNERALRVTEEQLRAPVRTRRGPQSLLILDSAPLEGYRHVLELYSRAAHGFVFVYSITARDTFVEAFQLIDGIHELRKRGRIAGVLVGNKSDLESQRATTLEEGQQLAERYGLAFFETSAKSAMHVDEVRAPRYMAIRCRATH